MPQVGHYAGQQHAGDEEQGPQQQELADSVPVSEKPYIRTHQPQDDPLEAEGKGYRAVAPAEAIDRVGQVRHQGGGGEPHRRRDEPHQPGKGHDDPGVVKSSFEKHKRPWAGKDWKGTGAVYTQRRHC